MRSAKGVFEVNLVKAAPTERALSTVRPDIVFNFAAAGVDGSNKQWPGIVRANVLGVTNLLHILQDFPPKHFIQMGTCFEYGSSSTNMKERDPLNPQTIYSASKLASTYLALAEGRTLNIPVTVFRAFTLYGPYDNPFRLISWVVLSLLRGETTIRLTKGKKEQIKDFLYVGDFVSFLEDFMSKAPEIKPFQIFNIGHDEPVSVETLIRIIAGLMRKKIRIVEVTPQELPFAARETEYARVVSDSTKAKQALQWRAKTSLRVGLQKTIRWFRKNQHLYSYD